MLFRRQKFEQYLLQLAVLSNAAERGGGFTSEEEAAARELTSRLRHHELVLANTGDGVWMKKRIAQFGNAKYRSRERWNLTGEARQSSAANEIANRQQNPLSYTVRTLGLDPATGEQIVLKDGRFGPYVTNGVTNAIVPRAQPLDEVNIALAVQLLQAKRLK
ncbi:topoisomerase C-terminal repeat-containing protein [Agromyces sp. MMS24-K17]|uniref:topoisomerase C-terminal repeat-containing protein n=1 Tax=Agromyces sp. MMS24-K17 TaxID=3372850 RepID=UPI00375502C8